MAIFCGEHATLPNAVREYKIEKSPFFRSFLPFEQLVRTLSQMQQLDAFLDVGLVGALVRRDVPQQPVLFGAPLGRIAVEEATPPSTWITVNYSTVRTSTPS